jgi:hypothetical protein
MMGYRDALIAALFAAEISPLGLASTVTRGSVAASRSAIWAVASLDGPTASTTSRPPGYSCPRT